MYITNCTDICKYGKTCHVIVISINLYTKHSVTLVVFHQHEANIPYYDTIDIHPDIL